MSVQAIAPEYKDWIKDVNTENISQKVSELEKEFKSIMHDILYSSKPDKEINKRIKDVGKRLMYVHLLYNMWKQPDPKVTESLAKLSDSMDLINKYEQRETLVGQKRSLDILTYISIIFLPLTLITGYFGMNFLSMGAPAKKSGILTIRWGQLFVLVLSIISIVGSVLILNHYYKVL